MQDAAARYAARPWLASYPAGVPTDWGDADVPLVPLTALLDDAAAAFPTRTAIAFLGVRITYRELRDTVDAFASALADLGVTRGDRVALVLPNCPQAVVAGYAALRLGAVVVANNPLSTEEELGHALADAGPTVVVCLDRTYPTVAAVRRRLSIRHVVATSLTDYLPLQTRAALRLPTSSARIRRRQLTGSLPRGAPVHSYLRLLRSAPGPAPQAPVDPAVDVAALHYTGGTTGRAKAAMLTHRNLVANAWQNRLWLADAVPGREVVLGVLPFFHAYGFTVAMNTAILLGATLVVLPGFDLDLIFTAVDEHRPTLLPGVPPIYQALADAPTVRQHDLRSIRVCISGSMRLPARVQESFEQITGGRLVEGYGTTEASPSTHANPLDGRRRTGSIGLPLPGTECRIVAVDDPSRAVPVGSAGELAVRGPQVFPGYWQRPEETAAVTTADGWLLTGDIATMSDDGYFTVVDRKGELIVAGGFNVYPAEVEAVVARHPAVRDCAVVGVADRYRGETVKAYVVLAPGERPTPIEVGEHCARSLTAYKVPRLVEFCPAIPRTPLGKVDRALLRRVSAADAQFPTTP